MVLLSYETFTMPSADQVAIEEKSEGGMGPTRQKRSGPAKCAKKATHAPAISRREPVLPDQAGDNQAMHLQMLASRAVS